MTFDAAGYLSADDCRLADYYANDLVAAVCRAWLGPGYQVTSQEDILTRAVAEGWSRQRLETELGAWNIRRTT